MKRVLVAGLCLLGSLQIASATEVTDSPSGGSGFGIPAGEWQSMVAGRTVTYMIDGKVWAQEAYDIKSQTVAIRLIDGSCMEGTWSHKNGEYCFAWDGGEYSCFLHVRAGSDILVIPVVDGLQSGTVQTVGGVSDAPLACGPALTS